MPSDTEMTPFLFVPGVLQRIIRWTKILVGEDSFFLPLQMMFKRSNVVFCISAFDSADENGGECQMTSHGEGVDI